MLTGVGGKRGNIPQPEEALRMKALIFLIFIAAGVYVMVWRMRKAQAEEARARRDKLTQRKKQNKEAVTPELDMVWPVIIRPVKGEESGKAKPEAADPAMTTIEYKPPGQAAS
jgi:hypothetical protein